MTPVETGDNSGACKRLATIPAEKKMFCVLRVLAYFVCRWILTDNARDSTHSCSTTFVLEKGVLYEASRDSPAATPAYVRDLFQVISLSHFPAPWTSYFYGFVEKCGTRKNFINAHKFVRNYNKNLLKYVIKILRLLLLLVQEVGRN